MKYFTLRVVHLAHYLYTAIVRPFTGERCRFVPCCSDYAVQAIETHGLARGSWLALKRLCRCQPLFRGGLDPVPNPSRKAEAL